MIRTILAIESKSVAIKVRMEKKSLDRSWKDQEEKDFLNHNLTRPSSSSTFLD